MQAAVYTHRCLLRGGEVVGYCTSHFFAFAPHALNGPRFIFVNITKSSSLDVRFNGRNSPNSISTGLTLEELTAFLHP